MTQRSGTAQPFDNERDVTALPLEVSEEDALCPHGWPPEFCGICHEEEEEEGDDA